MSSLGGLGHASARCSEGNGPIGLLLEQAFMGQSLEDPGDRDMADGHSRGQILDPADALNAKDLLDGFDIVLGGFRGVVTSGLAELVGDCTQLRFPDVDLCWPQL